MTCSGTALLCFLLSLLSSFVLALRIEASRHVSHTWGRVLLCPLQCSARAFLCSHVTGPCVFSKDRRIMDTSIDRVVLSTSVITDPFEAMLSLVTVTCYSYILNCVINGVMIYKEGSFLHKVQAI
jgi:hypothetical protein